MSIATLSQRFATTSRGYKLESFAPASAFLDNRMARVYAGVPNVERMDDAMLHRSFSR